MQQPLPADEYDDEFGDEFETSAEPPKPALTPDEIAAQSALEVFPGGSVDLESNEWWQQIGDLGDTTEAAPSTEATPEPAELPRQAPEASATGDGRSSWIGARRNDQRDTSPPPPSDSPVRSMWVEPDVDNDDAYEPVTFASAEADVEPPSEEEAAPTAARPRLPADELPRSVLSLPLRSGREHRNAAGASQRAAILAQAGAPLLDEEEGLDGAEAQLAVAMHGQPKAAPAAPRSGGRFLTRKVALSLFVIALGLFTLSGGAIAAGQGDEVERVASSLAPDVVEQWISDRVSSFGSTAPEPETVATVEVPVTPENQSLVGQIANTGGAGVSVRTTCVEEARTPATIAEGARVTVVARGVGDCTGWDVVRAGSAVSWVEAAYVAPLP